MKKNGPDLTRLLPVALLALMSAHQSAIHASSQAVKVYKNSGARQCRTVDVSVEAMGKTLTDNGIKVFSSTCAQGGLARAAACDFDAGLFYVYEVTAQDIQKASDLGFNEISKLMSYADPGTDQQILNRTLGVMLAGYIAGKTVTIRYSGGVDGSPPSCTPATWQRITGAFVR